MEIVGPAAVDHDDGFQFRQASADHVDLGEAGRIGDDRPDPCRLQPVFERLDAEQQRQRHGNGAELVDGDMGDGRLEALRQEQRDAVAAPHASGAQGIGKGVGTPGKLAECEPLGAPLGAIAKQCYAIGLDSRPTVGNGRADVEFLRDVPTEIAVKGVVTVAPLQHGRSSPLPRE